MGPSLDSIWSSAAASARVCTAKADAFYVALRPVNSAAMPICEVFGCIQLMVNCCPIAQDAHPAGQAGVTAPSEVATAANSPLAPRGEKTASAGFFAVEIETISRA